MIFNDILLSTILPLLSHIYSNRECSINPRYNQLSFFNFPNILTFHQRVLRERLRKVSNGTIEGSKSCPQLETREQWCLEWNSGTGSLYNWKSLSFSHLLSLFFVFSFFFFRSIQGIPSYLSRFSLCAHIVAGRLLGHRIDSSSIPTRKSYRKALSA